VLPPIQSVKAFLKTFGNGDLALYVASTEN